MKISYAIPVCNEHKELELLFSFLDKHKRSSDEIVVLCDEGNTSKAVLDVIDKWKNLVNVYHHPLNKNFAQQKNYLTKKCTGDWVFLIDADEYPDQCLCDGLHWMVENNPDVEAYWVSRINTVDGLRPKHIAKWGWNVNDKGWVNFPDRQMRIYKNEPDRIKWTNPVHEQLIGYKKFANLPGNEEYCLHHYKDIKKQEQQNDFYDKI